MGGFILARRNLRLGRGDRRGVLRLSMVFGTLDVASWMLVAHHVPTLSEIGLITTMFAQTLFVSGVIGMLYFALEPFVRRRWPVRKAIRAVLAGGRGRISGIR